MYQNLHDFSYFTAVTGPSFCFNLKFILQQLSLFMNGCNDIQKP